MVVLKYYAISSKTKILFSVSTIFTLELLIDNMDDNLFPRILGNENHTLHALLPDRRPNNLWTQATIPWSRTGCETKLPDWK